MLYLKSPSDEKNVLAFVAAEMTGCCVGMMFLTVDAFLRQKVFCLSISCLGYINVICSCCSGLTEETAASLTNRLQLASFASLHPKLSPDGVQSIHLN